MDKYVILTGANGYLGSYVCAELIRNHYNVIAFKYPHYASRIIRNDLVEYVEVDITQDMTLNVGLMQIIKGKKIEAIINTAALLGSSDYDRNYSVNAGGVENLISFSKALGITRFIQVSSVVILKPVKGPYGETKLIGQDFITASELEYTVFIPAMILGPESLGLNRILKNVFRFPLFVPLIGSGAQTQHPIFVKDFACMIVQSIEAKVAHKKVYQIAGNEVVTFRQFIKLILKLSGSKKVFVPLPILIAKLLGMFFQATQKIPVFTAEHVKGIVQDSNLDTTQIKHDLNFIPTPLEESLKYSLNSIGKNWDYYLNPRHETEMDV
jgi:nucleoside-diphosphate-sugar epimerase